MHDRRIKAMKIAGTEYRKAAAAGGNEAFPGFYVMNSKNRTARGTNPRLRTHPRIRRIVIHSTETELRAEGGKDALICVIWIRGRHV